MKKFLGLAALVVALVVPATADATVNRAVMTQCFQGYMWGQRFNPVAQHKTVVTCPTWTFFENGKYVTWSRPVTDLEAADRSASAFWPGCTHEWYAVNDQRSVDGTYYTYYHVSC